MEKNPANITIGPIHLSYARLWEAEAMQEGDAKKFSTSAIIPKSDKASIAKINAAIEVAKTVGKDTKFGGKTTNLKLPLRDGDDERGDDEAYQKAMFFNCNSTQRPGIVDANRNPIINKDDVYSGCYGYLNVTFYPYNFQGSKGVAVGLNHFMKTKDGEVLGGGVSADTAFDGIEVDDANDLL